MGSARAGAPFPCVHDDRRRALAPATIACQDCRDCTHEAWLHPLPVQRPPGLMTLAAEGPTALQTVVEFTRHRVCYGRHAHEGMPASRRQPQLCESDMTRLAHCAPLRDTIRAR